jgi:hypothetical protein
MKDTPTAHPRCHREGNTCPATAQFLKALLQFDSVPAVKGLIAPSVTPVTVITSELSSN